MHETKEIDWVVLEVFELFSASELFCFPMVSWLKAGLRVCRTKKVERFEHMSQRNCFVDKGFRCSHYSVILTIL